MYRRFKISLYSTNHNYINKIIILDLFYFNKIYHNFKYKFLTFFLIDINMDSVTSVSTLDTFSSETSENSDLSETINKL